MTASEQNLGSAQARNNELQTGYDDGYGKRLLDPTKGGPKYAAGYALGCEHRLADDSRADPHWPSDYSK